VPRNFADAEVRAIVFGCTTGSLLHGPGWDRCLSGRITDHVGIPCTTTATAAVDALRTLGARSVAIGTPYVEELHEWERAFFEGAALP
jgi:maleate isomerase